MAECECEEIQQSPHSPGVVLPGEGIVYVLIDPIDIDKITLAAAAAVMPSKQLTERRLSVSRAMHSTREIVQREVIDRRLADKPDRTFVGCWSVLCQTIRELTDDVGRTICVIDDGLPNNPGHAHLGFSAAVAAAGPSIKTAAKGNLVKAFTANGVLSLEQCVAE
jgi:hypothetical protein